MSNNELYEKAKRLVELTGVGRGYTRGSRFSMSPNDPRGKHEEMLVDLQIKLRAKHMTSAQLDALLEFYASEMGHSILEAQERIRKETSETLASLVENSSSKGVLVPNPGNNSGGDT